MQEDLAVWIESVGCGIMDNGKQEERFPVP